jgi:hypothetical protein
MLALLMVALTATSGSAQSFNTQATLVQPKINDLSSGDVLGEIHAARGEELHFRLYVPDDAQMLDIRTEGGRGDVDLYVRHGDLPRTTAFDARGAGGTSAEHIILREPAEGWWYITLRAFTDADGVEMLVRHDGRDADGQSATDVLTGGERITGLAARAGEVVGFRITVPQAAERLLLRMDGGRGDADLYLARGYEPTPQRYDVRSVGRANREQIDLARPAAGTWRLAVYAHSDFDGAELMADIEGGYGADPFLPSPAGLNLTRPAGHTVWLLGGTELVTWVADDSIRDIQIQLSLDGGRTWRSEGLPKRIDASLGEYFVKLPGNVRRTDQARVRIVDSNGRRLYDVSESFRIVAEERQDRHHGDLYESDDRARTPSRILLGEAQQRTIDPEDDQDYVVFVPSGAGAYVATFDRVTVELKVEVIGLDASGRQKKLDDFKVKDAGASVLFTTGAEARNVLFRVRANDDDDTGRYVMLVQRHVERPRVLPPLPPYQWPHQPQLPHRPDHHDRGRDDHRGDRREDRRDDRDTRVGTVTLRGDASKVENLAGREGSARRFRVQAPKGTKELTIHTEDGRGRIDLYVDRGQEARRNAQWRSRNKGTEQTVKISNPAAGWYNVTIYGREGYSGVEIAAHVRK